MAIAYLTGNDGSIVFPSAHGANFNTWNATFARNVTEVTGYSDTGRRRRLGVWDVTGSAGGTLIMGAASSSPSVYDAALDGASITLRANTACTYGFTAVVTDAAVGMTKTADATITFNFAISNGTLPTETWVES